MWSRCSLADLIDFVELSAVSDDFGRRPFVAMVLYNSARFGDSLTARFGYSHPYAQVLYHASH
jgi:hypothetical protein